MVISICLFLTNGGLDVSLLEGFDVDVALHVFRRHHRSETSHTYFLLPCQSLLVKKVILNFFHFPCFQCCGAENISFGSGSGLLYKIP
jgi:hypothetical protein